MHTWIQKQESISVEQEWNTEWSWSNCRAVSQKQAVAARARLPPARGAKNARNEIRDREPGHRLKPKAPALKGSWKEWQVTGWWTGASEETVPPNQELSQPACCFPTRSVRPWLQSGTSEGRDKSQWWVGGPGVGCRKPQKSAQEMVGDNLHLRTSLPPRAQEENHAQRRLSAKSAIGTLIHLRPNYILKQIMKSK